MFNDFIVAIAIVIMNVIVVIFTGIFFCFLKIVNVKRRINVTMNVIMFFYGVCVVIDFIDDVKT